MDAFSVFFVVVGLVFAAATIVWITSVFLKDASIIDSCWGSGFVLIVWSSLYLAGDWNTPRLLLAVAVSLWGLRLSIHLGVRNLKHGEDYRYQAMRERHQSRFWWVSLFTVFWLQASIMLVIGLPLVLMNFGDAFSPVWFSLGVLAWLIGFSMESIADWQLDRFRKNPDNKGKVLDRGLWRYSRHPNYFGDFMVWWGFFAMGLSTGAPWWTVLSPIVMSVFLMRVSGVPMLEKSLQQKRPTYASYIRRTSSFFPMPPRSI